MQYSPIIFTHMFYSGLVATSLTHILQEYLTGTGTISVSEASMKNMAVLLQKGMQWDEKNQIICISNRVDYKSHKCTKYKYAQASLIMQYLLILWT